MNIAGGRSRKWGRPSTCFSHLSLSKNYLGIVFNADVSADDLFRILMGIESPQSSWWIPDDGESS